MQKESDTEIRPQLTNESGRKLQMVVVYPYARTLGGDVGDQLSEAPVDGDITAPPASVVLRLANAPVVKRPERGIAEPIVELTQFGP